MSLRLGLANLTCPWLSLPSVGTVASRQPQRYRLRQEGKTMGSRVEVGRPHHQACGMWRDGRLRRIQRVCVLQADADKWRIMQGNSDWDREVLQELIHIVDYHSIHF